MGLKDLELFAQQESLRSAQSDAVSQSLTQGLDQNPDDYAKLLQISARTGVAPALAKDFRPELEKRARMTELSVDQMVRTHPKTAQFLSDRDNAAISHDDTSALKTIEDTLLAVPAGLVQGWDKQRQMFLNYKEVVGNISPAERAELEKLDDLGKQRAKEYNKGAPSWTKAASDVIGMSANSIIDAVSKEGTIGAGTFGATGVALSAVGGPAAPALAPFTGAAGAITGLKVGTTAGVLLNTYESSVGETYDDLKNFRLPDGTKLDPTVARYASLVAGAPNTALETFALGKALKAIPFADKVIGQFGRDQIKEILVRPTMRAAMADIGTKYAVAVGTETFTEGLQKFVSILAREAAIGATPEGGKAADPDWFTKNQAHSKQAWQPTTLQPTDEVKFREWLFGTKLFNSIKGEIAAERDVKPERLPNAVVLDALDSQKDYDYRAAWKKGITEVVSPHDGRPHWPSKADDGSWLKSPTHPTSWKEFFMQETGKDPDELKLDTIDKARAWSMQQLTTPKADQRQGRAYDTNQLREDAKAIVDESTEAFKASVVLGGMGGGVKTYQARQEVKKAEDTQAVFQAIADGVNESKTNKRVPERFQEFVSQMTKDGPVQNVYIASEEFSRFFQSQGVDPEQVANEVGVTNYRAAMAAGSDIVIPMEKFASKIAPTEYLQGIMQDARLRQGDMSLREAQLYQAEQETRDAELLANMEQIVSEQQAAGGFSRAVRQIMTDMEGQLVSIGMTDQMARDEAVKLRGVAVLVERDLKDRAARENRQVSDQEVLENIQNVWDRYGLTVNRQIPDVLTTAPTSDISIDPLLDSLRAGNFPTDREIFGRSLAEFIRDSGGVVASGETLTAQENMERRPFQKNLVQPNGMTLDMALEKAVGAGYFPNQNDKLTEADFLNALDEDLRGNGVYSINETNNNLLAIREAMNSLGDYLDSLGIDLNAITNNAGVRRLIDNARRDPALEGIVNELEQYVNNLAGQQGENTLYQQVTEGGKNTITGDLARVNLDVREAVDARIARLSAEEQQRVRDNLEKFKGTAWAAAAVKGMAYREMLERAMAGQDISKLEVNEIWGKQDMSATKLIKAFKKFPEHGDKIIKALIGSYDFIGGNRKAENDVSTSFTNCDPSSACATHCYAAGSNARPSEIAKSEFTEFMLEYFPDEMAEKIGGDYMATAAGKAGLALRLNDKGDLSPAQLTLVNNLNAQGITLQVFSKRPELLRQLSDANLKMLSVDSTNIDVALANTDLSLAVTITDDMTQDMLKQINDRVAVYLPVNLKGKAWTAEELQAAFPDLYPQMKRETLCPVDGGRKTTKPDTSFVNILDKTSEKNVWTCTACDYTGAAGCFNGDRKTNKRKASVVMVSDLQKELQTKKVRKELQANLDQLLALGGIDGELHKQLSQALSSGQRASLAFAGYSSETGTVAGSGDAAQAFDAGRDGAGQDAGGNTLYQSVSDITQTPAFKRWFGNSKVVDANGNPLVVYHGTAQSIEEFRAKQAGAIFVTADPKFAEDFSEMSKDWMVDHYEEILSKEQIDAAKDVAAKRIREEFSEDPDKAEILEHEMRVGDRLTNIKARSIFSKAIAEQMPSGPNIMALYVSAQNPFDYQNPEHIKALVDELNKETDQWGRPRGANGGGFYANGNWQEIEKPFVQKALKALGFDGFYVNEGGRKNLAVYSSAQIKSATGNNGEFDPNNPSILKQGNDDKRGYIQFDQQRKFNITLLEKANASTVTHELGHFYLEVLGDLATAEGAGESITKDYQTILEFLGVTSRDDLTLDGKAKGSPEYNKAVEMHEKFARANEAYWLEGKAPTPELQGVFQRFKNFLKLVYDSVKALNVQLNDDVRAVFDRIYATDAEIEAAKEQVNVDPIFLTAAEAGMSEQEFALYREGVAKTTESGKEALLAKLMREMQRERKAWWKEEREKMKADVTQEVDEQPVYRAFAALLAGKVDDDTPVKLNKQALIDRYGADYVKKLPRSFGRIYSPSGGMDADSAAEMLGYESGDSLLEALVGMRDRKDLIEAETDQRMLNKHGDMLNDGSLADEAKISLHNSQREDMLMSELRALRRKQREVAPFVNQAMNAQRQQARAATDVPPVEAFRRAAQGIVDQTAPRDLSPYGYLQASRRAAKAAFGAMAKGDYQVAADNKQKELLNHFLYLEATKAREEADKILTYARKFEKGTTRQQMGKAGADYLDQIDAILDRYEFRRVPLRQLDRRQSLNDWINGQVAIGNEPSIPQELLDESRAVNYRQIPMSELRAIRDAVRNIEHLARYKNKLVAKQAEIAFDDAIAELVASAENMTAGKGDKAVGERKPLPLDPNAVGFVDRAGDTVQRLDAMLLKMEQVVEWLDNGDVNGAWHTYLWNPIAEAQTREYDITRQLTEKLASSLEKMPKAQRTSMLDTYEIAGIGKVTRKFLISVALNMGAQSNIDKMMRGMGWNMATIETAMSKLNDADWTFVQETWDTINTLWPEIAALEKRMTGLEPPKVEAQPYQVRDENGNVTRTLAGGYYPLVYDPRKSEQGAKQEGGNLGQLFEEGYVRATTPKGHTQARMEGFAAPMLLDFEQVVTQHMAKVVKDLTHREAVVQANKILTNPQIRNALQETLGEHYEKQFLPWLRSVVNDRNGGSTQGVGDFSRWMMSARANVVAATMGFKATTMIAQITGISQSLDKVKGRYLGQALMEYMRHPIALTREVREKSGEMRNRSNTLDRDIRDQLRTLTGQTSTWAQAQKFAFHGIAIADAMVTVPTWMGAYRQAKAGGADEATAILEADAAVRMTQGSGGAKDLAAIQRNNELAKAITMFYSYFSVLYARQRDMGRDVQQIRDMPRFLSRVFFTIMFPAVMGELILGRGPDDDEDPAAWAIRKVLLYPLMTLPVLRDVASSIDSGFDYRFSPMASLFEKIVMAVEATGKIITDDDKEWGDYAARVADTIGYVFGVAGTAQISSTGKYLWRVSEGEEQPDNLAELLAYALLGKRKKD